MTDRMLYMCVLAGILIGVALLGKAVHDYRQFRMLYVDGRTAAATVVKVQPPPGRPGAAGRWALKYRFTTLNDQTIEAAVGVTGEMASRFRAGENINVVYAPDNPELSALNPEQAWDVVLWDERLLIPFLAAWIVLTSNAVERLRGRHA